MVAKKRSQYQKLVIVAYDISDNRLRDKIVTILERYGHRLNLSVFECMFTATELKKAQQRIGAMIKSPGDKVLWFPVCKECYARAVMQPEGSEKTETVRFA